MRPPGILRSLIAVISFLGAAHLGVRLLVGLAGREQVQELTALFHLDLEGNIPTWFSSCVLLLASGMLVLIALNERRERTEYWRHWVFLSLVFLYLGVDETVMIHETVGAMIRRTFHTRGLLYHAWVIPAAVAIAVLAVCYWTWLRSLPLRIRRLAVAAAYVYVSGAMGMEMIGGLFMRDSGPKAYFYSMATTAEEVLEMLGVALWIYVLAEYAALKQYRLTLVFGAVQPDRDDISVSFKPEAHSLAQR